MAALDQDALLLEYGDVYVGDDEGSAVNLGAVRNLKFVGAQFPIDIKSDNRGTVVKKNRINGSISFDWLEPGHMTNVENMLKGLVDLEGIAGALVAGAVQNVANPLVPNKFVKIANQNGNGNIIVVNSVTGSVDGALALGDDYFIVQDEYGNWGIVFNTVALGTTLTTLAQTAIINYDYTPNEALRITGGTSKVAVPRYVKVVGPSAEDASLTRTLVLTEATYDGDFEFPFLDTEEAGDVGVTPVSFINNKNAQWILTDEINPS